MLDLGFSSGLDEDKARLPPQQTELNTGQSFVFVAASINLCTIPHPSMCGLGNAFIATPLGPYFHQQQYYLIVINCKLTKNEKNNLVFHSLSKRHWEIKE